MKASRAKQLLGMAKYGSLKYAFVGRFGVETKDSVNFHVDGITESEDADIRGVWKMMSGNSSYSDALRAISRNREVTKLEVVDGNLTINYSNGDFTCAAVDNDLTARLIEEHLATIAPEVDEQYMGKISHATNR